MPGKPKTKETIRKNTVADMIKLGVYKPEYDPIIDIYCEMREQYAKYLQQLKDNDFRCSEYTAAGGTKKSALIGTIETLRKDILQYSDRLCLNPKALADKTACNTDKSPSKFEEALSRLG